ncbi:Uncharacterised protein [uncultured archaeon]|nr:Uncharacterised protein [uncultured archaeon]
MFELFRRLDENYVRKLHDRDIEQTKKLQHSEDLIREVFARNIEFGHVEYNKDDKVIPCYVSWIENSNEWFKYAKQHMDNKKYENIYQSYIKGEKYAEPLINQIVEKIEQYRHVMEQKLTDNTVQIPLYGDFNSTLTNFYDKKLVKHLVFHDVRDVLENREKHNRLTVKEGSFRDCSSLEWSSNDTVAVSRISLITNLQKLIIELENSETIVNIIKEINMLNDQLKNNNMELNKFNLWKEEIISHIRNTKKPLKGKCDIC